MPWRPMIVMLRSAIHASMHSRKLVESENGDHSQAGHDHHHDCLAGAALFLLIGTLLFGLTYSNMRLLPAQPSEISNVRPQGME